MMCSVRHSSVCPVPFCLGVPQTQGAGSCYVRLLQTHILINTNSSIWASDLLNLQRGTLDSTCLKWSIPCSLPFAILASLCHPVLPPSASLTDPFIWIVHIKCCMFWHWSLPHPHTPSCLVLQPDNLGSVSWATSLGHFTVIFYLDSLLEFLPW